MDEVEFDAKEAYDKAVESGGPDLAESPHKEEQLVRFRDLTIQT